MEHITKNKKYKPNMLNLKNFQIAVGATLILQPLEVMQTSMIATGYSKHNINFKGLSLLATQIYRDEGVKGFYRGTVLSIAKNTVSFSLFFTGIERYSPPTHYPIYLQSILNLIIASSSKLAGTIASTPLAVMKTKMQIVGNNEYNRIHHSFLKIAKEEGFFGFYRVPLIICRVFLRQSSRMFRFQEFNTPFIGIYWVQVILEKNLIQQVIPLSWHFVDPQLQHQQYCSPIHLIILELGNKQKHRVILETIKRTYKHEGIFGFYQGYLPRLIKKCIQSGVLWMVYEKLAQKQTN